MYTLAGLAHPEQGWGIAGETFHALAMMERLGGPAWFRLGDRDLATHLTRSEQLSRGTSLTQVTDRLCRALGVVPRVLPMSDAARPTMLDTDDGTLTFQEWLVGRRGAPVVRRVWWPGTALPTPAVLDAIAAADLVVIGPSNPYVSIDPILSLDGVRTAIAQKRVVAVSPIVGGRAVKGPLGGMIPTLAGREPSPGAIARHYDGLLHAMVIERGDERPPLRALATSTVMHDRDDRARLARELLEAFA
jgi:LPPG:FO 2-phospho-L-lactate transferase